MKHIRRPDWQAWTGVAVLLAVLVSMVASLILGLSVRSRFNEVSDYLYKRCQARAVYDASSQDARRAFDLYYAHYIESERTNQFIDARLRAQRIADAEALRAALQDTISKGLPSSCAPYSR